MAKKRNLKKDVNFLADEFFSDSFALMLMYDEENEKKIVDAMQKVADARNKFIQIIQNHEHKGERMSKEKRFETQLQRKKNLKNKLNEEFKNFIKTLEEGYEILGALSSK